ncbi:hypothetical protein KQX54_017745 [Cotesia glomerata]|uniref:Uncharacterized protein n=1 Tax=Cotesia glomerata TaxID=32391 RepID=A0AAV7IZR0_COTGL|nr:hypothetical protein KQX54_017745 [Cotesia glomerata]
MSGICCLSLRSSRCLWLTGDFDLPNTGWFLKLAFEFPDTQTLAQGRVTRSSAIRVYMGFWAGVRGEGTIFLLANSGWRGN